MRIAAFTMAFNESIFLPAWFSYYANNFGPENLYLLDHGSDDGSADIFARDRRLALGRSELDERERAERVAEYQAYLLRRYDVVVFTDTDEILIPRKSKFALLREFIEQTHGDAIRALGLNVIHVQGIEKDLDWALPPFSQRSYVQVDTLYSKTLITRTPVTWTPGFHNCSIQQPVNTDLFLFHLKNIDRNTAFENQKKFEFVKRSQRSIRKGHSTHFEMSPEQYIGKNFRIDAAYLKSAQPPVADLESADLSSSLIESNVLYFGENYHSSLKLLMGINEGNKKTFGEDSLQCCKNTYYKNGASLVRSLSNKDLISLCVTPQTSREILSLSGRHLRGVRLTLSFDVRSGPNSSVILSVEDGMGFLICHLVPNSRRIAQFRSEVIAIESAEGDYRRLSLTWHNNHEHINIATLPLRGRPINNQGVPDWEIRNIDIAVEDPTEIPIGDRFVYVDVGARGGVSDSVARFGSAIRPVIVDADAAECKIVATREKKWFGEVVAVPCGLADRDSVRHLFVTKNPACSSLLEPNEEVLKRYPARAAFAVTGSASVQCRRYDSLFYEGLVPKPDYIKIDVQGFEYEVLQGFGGLLDNVVGIELECHSYPLYRGQKLISDIVALLDRHGLSLRCLRPQNAGPVFGGEVCEFNAWFMRRDEDRLESDSVASRKWALCASITPQS